jgi:hypothetical protein
VSGESEVEMRKTPREGAGTRAANGGASPEAVGRCRLKATPGSLEISAVTLTRQRDSYNMPVGYYMVN